MRTDVKQREIWEWRDHTRNALTVAALSCILILTGVSSCAVVTAMSLETYTRVLMDASPELPIHFLNIYSIGSIR